MPFNGSGTFNALTPPTYPAVAGEVIYAARFNSVIQDILDGLSTCLTKDGQTLATANINLNGFAITGSATAAPGTNTTQLATTAFVAASFLTTASAAITYAGLASPALTGVPTAPTATTGTNTDQLATCAFVTNQAFSTSLPLQTGNNGKFLTTDGTTASWAVTPVYQDVLVSGTNIKTINSTSLLGSGNITLANGDASTNTAVSVDSELVLFSSTTGKLLKRATASGIPKLTSGVLGTAVAGTDFLAPPAGTALLKAASGGALANATVRTDYAEPTTALATGLLKNTTTTGAHSIAVAGTDYVAPGGVLGTPSSGTLTNCTGLPPAGVTGTAAVLGANTFTGDQTLGNNNLKTVKTVGFNAEYDNGNSATAATVTLTNGQKQKITLTGNATLTISTTSATVGAYQLRLIQDATGGRTVTWSGLTSTRWLGATSAPAINAAVNGETIITMYFDGTNITQSASKVGAV